MADEIAEIILGFGPKQSRNFLQHLGLTCFEIPLDSRLQKYFEKELNWYISAKGLSDIKYYHLVMDSIQELCRQAKIYPCLLDAAIFNNKAS